MGKQLLPFIRVCHKSDCEVDMEPEHIFWGVLAFPWVEFLWGGYLGRRQRKIYKKHVTVPPEAKDLLDADTFTKARLYALDKSNFGAVSGWFNQLLSTVLMVYFAFAFLWKVSGDFIVDLGFSKSDEYTPLPEGELRTEIEKLAASIDFPLY